ncbi:hypothetical protein ACTWPT_06860 [Nonomuraea sp. 3N208]|uniref:hypothetical protein n=1 Tax=Nonomuraea sp. 3N208 TaxID=3457421 RepID=UPI003FCE0231
MKPRDVSFVEAPFPEKERLLVKGKLDAARVSEPYLTNAERHGGVRRFPDDVTAGRLAGLPAGAPHRFAPDIYRPERLWPLSIIVRA